MVPEAHRLPEKQRKRISEQSIIVLLITRRRMQISPRGFNQLENMGFDILYTGILTRVSFRDKTNLVEVIKNIK